MTSFHPDDHSTYWSIIFAWSDSVSSAQFDFDLDGDGIADCGWQIEAGAGGFVEAMGLAREALAEVAPALDADAALCTVTLRLRDGRARHFPMSLPQEREQPLRRALNAAPLFGASMAELMNDCRVN
ncbi:hypothetical protein [Pseudoroseicyclus aestuarii]|uniref:Uncharacterized protein n=1 Tax=Pseudoroseicyclus aestuarii TaxID=1795041 RepID=A0A318SMH7_9RHOB|nr:hypothetical protein [Pseudoroseicyclus aestuarii]PYE80906.1 hypothetical protein DFP88_10938 [Pseudoroseicyclus aestuarii]